MRLLRHLECLTQIMGGVVNDGADYTMTFRDPGDEREIRKCPGCGGSLDEAYANGSLQDEGSAP